MSEAAYKLLGLALREARACDLLGRYEFLTVAADRIDEEIVAYQGDLQADAERELARGAEIVEADDLAGAPPLERRVPYGRHQGRSLSSVLGSPLGAQAVRRWFAWALELDYIWPPSFEQALHAVAPMVDRLEDAA